MIVAIVLLLILCLILINCLIHKSKENGALINEFYSNTITIEILYKFLLYIKDIKEISEETILNCLTNAVKRCVNNQVFTLEAKHEDGTPVNDNNIYEMYAKQFYKNIIDGEGKDD